MACLNLLKNEQQQGLYNPRISFSNDFADPQPVMKQHNSYREAPVLSDFEFSISNKTMISADELFSKGKLLPLKENFTKTITIRDELLVDDDDYDNVSPRLAKGTSLWKEIKRSHIVPKKADKSGVTERTDDLFHKQIYANLKGKHGISSPVDPTGEDEEDFLSLFSAGFRKTNDRV